MDSRASHDGSGREARRDALLARWRDTGDREALDQLLRVELEPVKRSFRRRLAARARSPSLDTTDFVDEAVARMLRLSPAPDFDDAEGLRAYLAEAAVNLFRNHYRSSRARPIHVTMESLAPFLADESGQTPSHNADLRELAATIELALDLLDDDQAELLRLSLFEGVSVRDLGGRIGVSTATAARRVARAKSLLLRKMLSWREWMAS